MKPTTLFILDTLRIKRAQATPEEKERILRDMSIDIYKDVVGYTKYLEGAGLIANSHQFAQDIAREVGRLLNEKWRL